MNDFPTVHIVKSGSNILTVFATRNGADVYVAKVIAGWKILYGSTFEFDPASIEILEEKVYP